MNWQRGCGGLTPWASRFPAPWSRHRPGRARPARRPGGRSGWPRPSASWRSDRARPSWSVRRPGGPSPAMPRALLSMPSGDGRGADRRGGGLQVTRRRAGGRQTERSTRRAPSPRQRGRQDAGPRSAAGGGRAGRVAPDGRARAGAAARGRGGRAGREAGPLGVGGRPTPDGPAGVRWPRGSP
jgi:hypothetical protein